MQVNVLGVPIEVEVSNDGIFSTELNGEPYSSESLTGLKGHLVTAIKSAKYAIPFVDYDGDRGTIRGYHQGRREILVTWESGRKASVETYRPVFRVNEVSADEVAEIKLLEESIDAEQTRLKELREKTVGIEQLLNDAALENITGDYRWARNNPELVK